ncbi:MAG: hypothetical protein ABWU84_12280 [Pyrobaculum sp.]|uniref:hypothetical protein n=1 Tax=Pyrobaculum sp. TaxID=2004705 RepID=UPI003EE89A9E
MFELREVELFAGPGVVDEVREVLNKARAPLEVAELHKSVDPAYSVYALVPRGRDVAVLKNIAALLAKNRRWRPADVYYLLSELIASWGWPVERIVQELSRVA